MPKHPNPQGKGVVPVLQSLHQHRLTRRLPPKKIDQVEMELFTSLFVLGSDIRFNPVPEKSYWLYQDSDRFRLSLIGPDEWVNPRPGRCIGECRLHEDRTWTLALDADMEQDREFMAMIEARRRALRESLENADSVEAVLPRYEENLGFHARILAFTLGRSLDASMAMAGIRGLTYSQAKGLLGRETPGSRTRDRGGSTK